MKRVLFFVFMAAFILSCEGPEGPPGRDGRPGKDKVYEIYYVTLYPDDWDDIYERDKLIYYRCYVDFPEITEDVFEDGAYVTYLEQYEEGILVHKPLPYTINEGADWNSWTRMIECDYNVGEMAFYIKVTDSDKSWPKKMTFRVILMF